MDTFDYEHKNQLSTQQLLSLALFKCKTFGNVSQDVHSWHVQVVRAMMPDTPALDIRTVQKLLETSTGIAHRIFDICQDGCICYAAYPDSRECHFYHKPRYKPDGVPLGPHTTTFLSSTDWSCSIQMRNEHICLQAM